MFILLAHLICLCLAMIVYAIHGSRWCCRWIWWGLAAERGKTHGNNFIEFIIYGFGIKL